MMEIKENENNKNIKNYLKNIKLMVFDMDGVLLKNRNSWDVIINKAIKNNYYNDYDRMEYTFNYIYENNVPENYYKYLNEYNIKKYLNINDLSENANRTVDYLKSKKIKTAIVSAGSHCFAEYLSDLFGIDYFIGNMVNTDKKTFIKNVDPLYKDENIKIIQKKFNVKKENTISIGDSFYDLSMKRASKYFIAFNPSNSEMLKHSDFIVNSNNLYDIIKTLTLKTIKV